MSASWHSMRLKINGPFMNDPLNNVAMCEMLFRTALRFCKSVLNPTAANFRSCNTVRCVLLYSPRSIGLTALVEIRDRSLKCFLLQFIHCSLKKGNNSMRVTRMCFLSDTFSRANWLALINTVLWSPCFVPFWLQTYGIFFLLNDRM